MKILVLGNMGYVGPVVVERLAAIPSSQVIGYDSGYFAHCLTPGSVLPERTAHEQLFGDVRRLSPEVFSGVDSVVYLAAISNDPMGDVYAEPTRQINHESAVRSAALAKAAGVKHFVFASSCSVYGKGDGSPRGEDSEVCPLTEYARSKVAAENDLSGLASKTFFVTCLRFATACGFSDRIRLDLVLNDFVATALATGKIEILSDGLPWRPVIHVKDMARAIEWAIQRSNGTEFLVVNVGRNDCNLQVRDLARAVADCRTNVDVLIKNERPTDQRSYQVDFTLFHSLAAGFLPEFAIDRCVRDLVKHLEDVSLFDAGIKAPAFIRLNVLRDLITRGLLDESLCWRSDS
jgi:nucleoside-diphosphate-sugar epimerase